MNKKMRHEPPRAVAVFQLHLGKIGRIYGRN